MVGRRDDAPTTLERGDCGGCGEYCSGWWNWGMVSCVVQLHVTPDILHWNWLTFHWYNIIFIIHITWSSVIFSEISGSHSQQRRFPVIILHSDDAQVGGNNFNWRDFSSVKLIKLPRENLKTQTDSGEKLRLSKFTQVMERTNKNSILQTLHIYF